MRIAIALALVAAFGALTWAVTRDSALRRFDDRVMAALRRRRTARLDSFVGPLAMFATQEPLTLQSLIAFVMIIVTIGGSAVAHFVVLSAGSGILANGVKRLIGRPRPAGPHLLPWFHSSAFPSGDLVTATAIYLTIAFIADPYLPGATASAAMFACIGAVLALIAAARVYAGVHHPTDVLAGACLGAAWALVVSACF